MIPSAQAPARLHPALITILILSYLTGIISPALPGLADWFRLLTPVHLTASLVVLLWFHTDWRPAFLFYALLAVLTGYFVEVLGVHTGYVFGQYAYGRGLGPRLWEVPPVIGLNWLLLSYCCGAVFDRLPVRVYIKTVAAATTMVLLDILIEPVAIQLDFWTWFGRPVPLQNYFGWWLISLALLAIWYGLPFRKHNLIAGWLLGLQFAFFLGHRLFSFY